ncbi:unnamed protein product [Amoebophrya sp. A25]|nr:unnamed protein product [Amoebophrya sp. A25]|eukprot:GSA25T00002264001.1
MIPHGTNRFLFTPVKRSSATSSTDGNQNKQELGVCADKKKLPETTKHVQLAVGKYDLEQLALAATLLQTVDERAGPKARLKMAQKKRNARRKKHDCMVEELMSPLLDDRAVFFYEAGNDVVEDGDSLNFEEVKNPKKNPAHRGSVPSGTRTSSGAKNSGTPKSGRAAAPYGSASFSASPAPASRNRKGMNTQTNSKQPKNPFVFKESEHIYDRSKIDSPSSSPAEKIAATFYLPLKQQRDGAKKKAPRGVGFPPYEDYSTNYPQRSASSNVEMKGNSNSSTSMTNGAAAIDISTSLLYDLPGPPPVLSADGRVDVFPSLRNRPGPVLDVPINYQVIRSDDDKVKVEDAQHTTRTAPCSPTREENYALRRRRAACKQEWRTVVRIACGRCATAGRSPHLHCGFGVG